MSLDIRKQFSRFRLCDSFLSCFSKTMISLQFTQLEKGASQGLCLEFILHEYVKALSLTEKLSVPDPVSRLEILEKLHSDPSCVQEHGILDKLCFYCETLIQGSKIGEHLLGAVDELCNLVALPRTILSRQLRSISGLLTRSVEELLKKLQDSMHSFFSLLQPVFKSCLDCEAPLFALLELRESINCFLGENTVERFLQELFPDGPQMLRQTISNGFSKRGFSHFYQNNEGLLEGLKWPQPTKICAEPEN